MTEPQRPRTEAEQIAAYGDLRPGKLTAVDGLRMWMPVGTCTKGDRAGSSISRTGFESLAEARAARDEMREAEGDRFDTWEVVRLDSLIRTVIEPD